MTEEYSLYEVLNEFLDDAGIRGKILLELVNKRVGYNLLKISTLNRWLSGDTKTARNWQPFVGIGLTLRRSTNDVNRLLTAARQPELSELSSIAVNQRDRRLLKLWNEYLHYQLGYHPPKQLPTRVEHFVGQKGMLAYFSDNITLKRVEMLYGPAGIGKTAFIAEVLGQMNAAGKLFGRFPDGVILLDFQENPRVDVALETIIRAYNEKPRPNLETAARRALNNKQALLVLDGTENADNLQKIMDIKGDCGVLIAGRKREAVALSKQRLRPLSLDDSVKLLQKWGGVRAGDVKVLKEIGELVGFLPLALRLAATRMANADINPAELRDQLKTGGLEALEPQERGQKSVRLLLKKSLDQVDEKARRCLAVAGLLAQTSFDRETIAAALKLAPIDTLEPMGDLALYSLLERFAERFKITHTLIHIYARQEMRSLIPVNAARNLAVHFAALSTEQTELAAEGYRKLDQDRPHFMAVIDACRNEHHWIAVKDLVQAVDRYFDMQGYWTNRAEALAAGIFAAQESGDQRNEAVFRRKQAITFRSQGRLDRAFDAFDQALRIWKRLDDHLNHSGTMMDVANLYLQQAEWSKAIETYQQGLADFRHLGDRHQEAMTLSNMAIAQRRQGQLNEAITSLEDSLQITRDIGDRLGETSARHNIGRIYIEQEKWEKAEQVFIQTQKSFHELGSRKFEVQALGSLGEVYLHLKQWNKALEKFQEVLLIFQQMGNRYNEAYTLGGIGDVYLALERWDEALENYQGFLSLAGEIKDQQGEAEALKRLGDFYLERGPAAQADEYYAEALAIYQRLGNGHEEGVVLVSRGRLREMTGEPDQAIRLWQEARSKLRPESSEYREVSGRLENI